MNAQIPLTATITSISSLTADTSLYTLTCPAAAINDRSGHNPLIFLPGQFLQLSLPGIGEIPISYCGVPSHDGSIELCLRHVGRVTNALRNMAVGEELGVRGPFGNGFPLEHYAGDDLLLIAGGLGLAPIRSLLRALLQQRQRWGEITLLYGARQPELFLFVDELRQLVAQGDVKLLLGVDRPGAAPAGLPASRTALLPALLEDLVLQPERTSAALCAPPAAYPALVAALQRQRLADQRIDLSLERQMHCGVGRCGHCAVGTLLCCVDGPVFSLAQLQGIEGALA